MDPSIGGRPRSGRPAATDQRGGNEMKPIHMLRLFAVAPGLLIAPAAFAGLIVSAPVDVIGNLPAATFTGLGYGTRSYKD